MSEERNVDWQTPPEHKPYFERLRDIFSQREKSAEPTVIDPEKIDEIIARKVEALEEEDGNKAF